VSELFGGLVTRTAGGVVVGVQTRTERTVHAFGASGTSRPLGERTLFEIGSVTKTFTTTLLAEMVVRGEVALDDPIDRYLTQGVRRRARAHRPITLRALATHSAGLPRLPRGLLLTAIRHGEDPYAGYTLERLEQALSRTKPRRIARFRYSNFGFALLGRALEKAVGVPYEDLVVNRICRPLGLEDTHFSHPPDDSRWGSGHHRRHPVPTWDLSAFAAAGGLRSSAADMMRYLRSNAHPGQTPLAEALELAHRPQRRVRRGRVEVCLGWMRIRTESGRPATWHNGGTGGFRASVAFDLDAEVAALSNSRLGRALDVSTLRLLDQLVAEGPRR
jgi:CubicO group peptidase (beta-lactamase class C family)